MPPKKVVAVIGATGLQGGSVVKFLLEDGTFDVRAITRDPTSAAAKDLITRGVHVVKADSRDTESLVNAFEGAYGVFGVTNYWEPGVGEEGERTQGKALVDAAKSAGIKHFVWSTLDHSQFPAPHWESKADVDDYLKASGLPRTSLYTSFYFENFVGPLPFKRRPDGSFDFPLPLITGTPFGVYSAADTGAWVLAAFKCPEKWLDHDMRIASEFLSARDLAKTITEISGKTVHVQEASAGLFETFKGNLIPDGLHASFELVFHYNKPPFRDPALTRTIYPDTKVFKIWAGENIGKIIV